MKLFSIWRVNLYLTRLGIKITDVSSLKNIGNFDAVPISKISATELIPAANIISICTTCKQAVYLDSMGFLKSHAVGLSGLCSKSHCFCQNIELWCTVCMNNYFQEVNSKKVSTHYSRLSQRCPAFGESITITQDLGYFKITRGRK